MWSGRLQSVERRPMKQKVKHLHVAQPRLLRPWKGREPIFGVAMGVNTGCVAWGRQQPLDHGVCGGLSGEGACENTLVSYLKAKKEKKQNNGTMTYQSKQALPAAGPPLAAAQASARR